MRPKPILSLLLIFTTLYTFAQRDLEISIERNSDQSADFNYIKNKYGMYIVKVKLNELANSSSMHEEYETVALNPTGTLLKLKPSDNTLPITFKTYSYQYMLGSTAKVDTNFVYALPLPSNTEYFVRNAGLVTSSIIGEKTPDYFKSFKFRTQESTDILAIRKGTVIEILDKYEVTPDTKFSYKSAINKIVVQHQDGSLAVYNGFMKGTVKVKEGDTVYPQSKLASSVKYNDSDKSYTFSVRVIYPKDRPFDIPVPTTLKESIDNPRYNYVNIKFFYGDNTPTKDYKNSLKVPELSKDIVQKEFSKKELKKLAAK